MLSKEGLKLDPGTTPKRTRRSTCKCIGYSLATIALVGLFLALFTVFSSLRQWAVHPHKWMYHNATLEEVKNRRSVVQPLIGATQTFDIVATVWIREPGDESKNEESKGDGIVESVTALPRETSLFSDVVFRGLTLKDKWASKSVDLRIPTKVLYAACYELKFFS